LRFSPDLPASQVTDLTESVRVLTENGTDAPTDAQLLLRYTAVAAIYERALPDEWARLPAAHTDRVNRLRILGEALLLEWKDREGTSWSGRTDRWSSAAIQEVLSKARIAALQHAMRSGRGADIDPAAFLKPSPQAFSGPIREYTEDRLMRWCTAELKRFSPKAP